MNDHCDRKVLEAMALGKPAPDRDIEHLGQCAVCAGRLERLRLVLSPSASRGIEPSQRTLERIRYSLWTVRRRHAGRSAAYEWLFRFLSGRGAYAIAAAAIVAIIITIAVFMNEPSKSAGGIPLTVTYIRGKAYLNNMEIRSRIMIAENSIIRVPRHSELVLALNNTFTLTIRGESAIEISESDAETGDRAKDYVFHVYKGSLFARFGDNGRGNRFYYITPTARIRSDSSDFTLRVSDNRTVVIPKSDALRIQALESDDEITPVPDTKYVITSSIESNEMNASDELNVDLLKNIASPLNEEEILETRDLFETLADLI